MTSYDDLSDTNQLVPSSNFLRWLVQGPTSLNRTKRAVWESVFLATFLTLLLEAVTVWTGHKHDSWLSMGAVWTSFASTWLCTKQVRFNYVWALISTSLLVVVFYQSKLYGSMVLNLYMIPTVIYGWFIWRRDTDTKPVQHVTVKAGFGYAAVTAVTWLGAFLVIHAAGGKLAVFDGWILVGNVLAQWLMDRKKLENWLIWALVNAVAMVAYFHQGLYLLAGQYVLFLANSVYAWFMWRKSMVMDKAATADPTVSPLVFTKEGQF